MAIDRDSDSILVVEVKDRIAPKDESYLKLQLQQYADNQGFKGERFFALADRDRVRFYRDQVPEMEQVAEVSMHDLNREYASGDAHSEGALASVVMAWLQDLAFQWKSGPAPGMLTPGLLDLLKQSTLIRQSALK